MKAYPDAKVTTKNGTASLSGCPLCEGPQDMVHLCLHLHLPDWLGSNIVRSIWPIWRTPSHSSPVLLLEKHPTAKWLVEQVFYKNIDCKIWTKGKHALSRLTEGDHVLMTWLTSWTLDPSKAAKPLSGVGRTEERITNGHIYEQRIGSHCSLA